MLTILILDLSSRSPTKMIINVFSYRENENLHSNSERCLRSEINVSSSHHSQRPLVVYALES